MFNISYQLMVFVSACIGIGGYFIGAYSADANVKECEPFPESCKCRCHNDTLTNDTLYVDIGEKGSCTQQFCMGKDDCTWMINGTVGFYDYSMRSFSFYFFLSFKFFCDSFPVFFDSLQPFQCIVYLPFIVFFFIYRTPPLLFLSEWATWWPWRATLRRLMIMMKLLFWKVEILKNNP